MTIEHFKCADGDEWYSVVENGDVVTGVMHGTREQAEHEWFTLSTDLLASYGNYS